MQISTVNGMSDLIYDPRKEMSHYAIEFLHSSNRDRLRRHKPLLIERFCHVEWTPLNAICWNIVAHWCPHLFSFDFGSKSKKCQSSDLCGSYDVTYLDPIACLVDPIPQIGRVLLLITESTVTAREEAEDSCRHVEEA